VEILVNNYPVDFTIENEKTAPDVVDSILKWCRQKDLILSMVYIDDEIFALDQIPDRSIDSIKILNCLIQSRSELVFASVDEGIRYCEKADAFAAEAAKSGRVGRSDMVDIASGLIWLGDIISNIINLLGLKPETVKYRDINLPEYISLLENFNSSIENGGENSYLEILKSNANIFQTSIGFLRMLVVSDEMKALVMQSIDSPDVLMKSLLQIKDSLPSQLDNIEATAAAFQAGKDSVGIEGFKNFLDFIAEYVRTSYQIGPVFDINISEVKINGASLEEKNRILQDFLNKTVEIMENSDIISLSDMLEYEIKPSLGDLGNYIDLIQDMIQGK
jgi:hypothetical protein